jgi:hypothetical protein
MKGRATVFAFLASVCIIMHFPITSEDTDVTDEDNGGPGTYSQLLMIKEYMIRLATDRGIDEGDVHPADYFDLMGGVGFGGYFFYLICVCVY